MTLTFNFANAQWYYIDDESFGTFQPKEEVQSLLIQSFKMYPYMLFYVKSDLKEFSRQSIRNPEHWPYMHLSHNSKEDSKNTPKVGIREKTFSFSKRPLKKNSVFQLARQPSESMEDSQNGLENRVQRARQISVTRMQMSDGIG